MKYIILARNAYLSEDIEDFLKELQNKANNAKVKKYVSSNIRKYLINDFPASKIQRPSNDSPSWLKEAISKGEEVYSVQLKAKDKNTISHWVDYLNTLPTSKDLSRISIPQLINHVKEWEESFKKGSEEEDGIEVIHKYSDGYKWVKVFGKKSLEREGKLMNHCVGSYYQQVKENKTSIYSLRDKSNKPHVTIEIKDKEIKQIQGNSNKPPKEEYKKYVLDFLNKRYVKFDKFNSYDLKKLGYIKLNGVMYTFNNIPDGLTVTNLNLSQFNVSKLPDNLTVTNNLNISFTKIVKLPKNLTATNLNLSGTNITELPNDLVVKENLDLSECEHITELPNNLSITGELNLGWSSILKLPNNLSVTTLNLVYTNIKEIPEGVKAKEIIISKDMKVINHSESYIRVH